MPDILANADGVVASYFEWAQANQSYRWTEDDINERLAERMERAWNQVLGHSATADILSHLATTCIAVERMRRAHEARGLYR